MDRSLFELSPGTRWLGRRLYVYRQLDSTNLAAEALAARGAPEGAIVLADGQTAGRGRLGRSFYSPPGRSIYLSALLRPEVPAHEAPHFVFAAAVAVAETVAAHVGDADPEIKWPNDVLLSGRKTSGINLPVGVTRGRVDWLVLGIGLNVNLEESDLPPELRPIATSLRIATGHRLDRIDVAEDLIRRLERWVDRLRADGFERVLDAWLKFFRMRGARVRIGGPGVAREIEGRVSGVDPDGALLLKTETSTERILAGDVTVLDRHE